MEKEIDYVALGMRIRKARKDHHVTQEHLGEICELSTAHIGHIERGTRIPSLDTLFRISQALDVSIDHLIFDSVAPDENMSITMAVASDYASSLAADVPIYYFGVSKGGQYGAMYGYRYPFVQKWLLLNLPITINWHKSRAGLMKMPPKQEVTMIFGEHDPSYAYAELIDFLRKENVKRVTVPVADHNFSNAIDEFIRLPEQFLF